MIGDIATVMWKEWRELLPVGAAARGRNRAWSLLVVLLVFGIFLPLQSGREWVESPLTLLYWGWVPLFMVTSVIADAFAGERERHTLETLLATRLPDTAILLGKLLTAVLYGWGLAAASLLLGLITVNLTSWSGTFLFYSPLVLVGGTVLGLLTAGLAAGVGVLVSLRASSVRQAAQTMSIAIMLLLFVPIFGFQALPRATQAGLITSAQQVNATAALLVAGGALLLVDIVVYGVARLRFRRDRLALDA